MDDLEHKPPSEEDIWVEVTDKKILGALDPERIPLGYGVVRIEPHFIAPGRRQDEPEYVVITNNTGDARLYLDPDTRSMSSMELAEVELNGSISGLKDLPPEYQGAMSKVKMPDIIQITKSTEAIELLFAVGTGTSEDPLRAVQRTAQTYKDMYLLIHLALARHAYVAKQQIFLLVNGILYTYTPKNGVAIEVEAAVTFRHPTGASEAEVTWYRKQSSVGRDLEIAESAFKRV